MDNSDINIRVGELVVGKGTSDVNLDSAEGVNDVGKHLGAKDDGTVDGNTGKLLNNFSGKLLWVFGVSIVSINI